MFFHPCIKKHGAKGKPFCIHFCLLPTWALLSSIVNLWTLGGRKGRILSYPHPHPWRQKYKHWHHFCLSVLSPRILWQKEKYLAVPLISLPLLSPHAVKGKGYHCHSRPSCREKWLAALLFFSPPPSSCKREAVVQPHSSPFPPNSPPRGSSSSPCPTRTTNHRSSSRLATVFHTAPNVPQVPDNMGSFPELPCGKLIICIHQLVGV